MEVRSGYKQTEVGMIPVDWEVKALEKLATMVASGRSNSGAAHGSYPVHGSTGVIGYTENPAYEGDAILAARVGANAGRLNLVSGKYGVTDNTIMVRLKSSCSLQFFWRQLESKRLNSLVFGSGQPLITGTQLKALPLCVPPLPEQRAIAEALSEVDALIGALDQLIAKKCDLKQAAMQQLLTGFKGEWTVTSLHDVASVTKGTQLHGSESTIGRKFAHLNGGVTASGYTHKSNTPANTIAISEGGNSCGHVQFMAEAYWCGGHCYSVIPTGIENRFLYHALKGQQTAIMGLRVGSGLPNVQKTALLAFKLRYPTTESEQTAIAAVLTDMDAELMALEERRAKTRALKQGMMQELLTGRTRLV